MVGQLLYQSGCGGALSNPPIKTWFVILVSLSTLRISGDGVHIHGCHAAVLYTLCGVGCYEMDC